MTDWSVTHGANQLLVRHDALEDVLGGYERVSQALFVLVLLGLVLAGGPLRRRAAVAAGAATAAALLAGQLVARVVDRPRPFVTHAGAVHLFAPHAADPGFPSDHATGAFAIAAAVCAYQRRLGALLVALAAVLAAGRVALGVHYPTDVLAGAALGAGAALAIVRTRARELTDAAADRLTAIVRARRTPAPRARATTSR